MPPKKKGGKKGKPPAFYTSKEDLEPFGFQVRDIIRTPLGITGTVIGVKYTDREDKSTGKLWVEYSGGRQSPLEVGLPGYFRCSDAEHVWRDVVELRLRVQKEEEERAKIEEANRLFAETRVLAELATKKKNKPKAAKPAG